MEHALSKAGIAKKMNDQENDTAGAELQPEEELTVEEGSADRKRTKRRRSGRPEIPVKLSELRELIDLVREHDFTEFELSREDFRVRFRRGPEAAEAGAPTIPARSEEHTSELQSQSNLVCRLLLEKKKTKKNI